MGFKTDIHMNDNMNDNMNVHIITGDGLKVNRVFLNRKPPPIGDNLYGRRNY
jgi:hypothetical protein